MPFQLYQAICLGTFQKGIIQSLIFKKERYIHKRATGFIDRITKKVATIDKVVEQRCLRRIFLSDRFKTTLIQQPLEYQTGDIDAVSRRRIQHGGRSSLLLPVKY